MEIHDNYKFINGEDVDESITKNKSIDKLKKYIIFFNNVEQRYQKQQPEIYRKVINTIKESKDKKDLTQCYSQIIKLIQGENDLIEQFNNFFPKKFLKEYNNQFEKERYEQFDQELDKLICSQ